MSKKFSGFCLTLILLLTASSLVFAQAAAPVDSPENKTIFSYKKELGMTDEQEKNLNSILEEFQQYFNAKKDSLIAVEKEIADLVTSKGSLETIKAKIDDLAKLKAEVTFKDIETSRRVESVLKPEQIEQWKMIQTEAIEMLRNQMAAGQASTPAPMETVK
jgi:hypothetical protein